MSESLRQEVCKAIVSLPAECSLTEAKEKLDPLFESVVDVDSRFESKTSPLLIACDRGNSSCLQYLSKKRKEDENFLAFIGRPLDPCSDEDFNTAVHHAAISGCEDFIKVFKSTGDSMESLASIRNAHDDTPLMMAAANNHINFLKTIHQFLLEEHGEEVTQSIFLAKNNSEDSCLSLASCHGHFEVVEFLLTIAQVEAEVLDLCKNRLESMFDSLKRNPNLTQQHLDRLNVVRKCVDAIEKKLAHQAELAAAELLLEETDEVEAKKPKGKRKKNKKKKPAQAIQNKGNPSQNEKLEDSSSDEEPEVRNDALKLKILSDGTIAVAVQGQAEEGRTVPMVQTRIRKDSVDELFQKQLKGKSPEIDAVMDALCLEASMLLYTPLGMALNLSPSQLDAIQGILERQLVAVQEARGIQERKHSSAVI